MVDLEPGDLPIIILLSYYYMSLQMRNSRYSAKILYSLVELRTRNYPLNSRPSFFCFNTLLLPLPGCLLNFPTGLPEKQDWKVRVLTQHLRSSLKTTGLTVGTQGWSVWARRRDPFFILFSGRTIPSCKGLLLCTESVSEAFWLRVTLAQEQMTGRQAVCPLLGNKARIPLTQCDN